MRRRVTTYKDAQNEIEEFLKNEPGGCKIIHSDFFVIDDTLTHDLYDQVIAVRRLDDEIEPFKVQFVYGESSGPIIDRPTYGDLIKFANQVASGDHIYFEGHRVVMWDQWNQVSYAVFAVMMGS